MRSRQRPKVLKVDGGPISSQRDSAVESKPPAARRAAADAPADRQDELGLSARDIDLLKNRLTGQTFRREETDGQDAQAGGQDLAAQLLQGQSELLKLSTMGSGREVLLEHLAVLTQRLLGPAICTIRIADGKDGVSRAENAPESGMEQGVRTCWSHRILSLEGTFQGTITVYRHAPGEPGADDWRVLDAVADMARFVIQSAEREEALNSAQARFASLAASIPGVVYQRRVTPEGDIRYTYISEGAKDLFGVTAGEIMADPKALFDCHGPEYRADFRERLLVASRKLEMWDVEAQIITAKGEEIWTHAIARPHLECDGSVLWDGVILDATRIKSAEIDLRHAKEAAEAASRAKTLFLAQVSHELRTPLNAVIGFAEMLGRQLLGPLGHAKYEEYARDIESSGQHLLSVINSILEFTSLENGSANLQAKVVDLRAIADKAVAQCESLSKLKNIGMHNNIRPDIPSVLGDEEKLDRILNTLVSNAVKFTPDGGEVRVEGSQDVDGTVVVSVVDSGIGIAPEDIPKVFEPFTQIDNELSRKYEGLGLGMPLAAAMAEMHGGWISIDSEPGRGTKVSLSLPKSSAAN